MRMKFFARLFFLIFLSFVFLKTSAQQKHFIYVESENNQPFALVMNGKVYSSSDFGYVIVPKLDDGTYNFTISFPLNKFPDQNFKCVVDKKDVGYKLLSTAEKSWALQNMQTQQTITSGNAIAAAGNAFGNMLSDVVNDSTLTKKTTPAQQADTVASTPGIDTTMATPIIKDSMNTTANNSTNLVEDSLNLPQKISENIQDTGTNMIFVDKNSGGDTIHIFVPASDSVNNTASAKNVTDTTTVQPQNINTDSLNKNTVTASSSKNVDTSLHAVSNPFYKSANQQSSSITNTDTTTTNTNVLKTTSAVRSDCNNMISDNDLDKIKRKMFVQNNDNAMVQTAIRNLNNKCITTAQVKMLGSIFSSDDGRYNLYDALYKQTYDYGNYANLESQIIDPYYKRRFEVMLR